MEKDADFLELIQTHLQFEIDVYPLPTTLYWIDLSLLIPVLHEMVEGVHEGLRKHIKEPTVELPYYGHQWNQNICRD